jgi:nitrite reductase/ring-hydroxylating ferredoxin subunit/uncharacterized membrane protein
MVDEAVMERLEGFEPLDQVTDRVAPVLERALSRPPLADALTGRWLGHPVHPMSAVAPLGFWFSATTLDLVGGRRGAAAARRLVGLGVLSALPTAASGASDWIYTTGAERRVGAAHALTNNVATALFALSWWSRVRGRRLRGVGLGLAGSAVAGVGGFLGGHLAYRLGVGVNTSAFQAGPEEWTAVLDADDLPADRLTAVRAGGAVLALVRRGERVYAIESRCSHRGGPLSDGQLEGDCLRCPWHGGLFRLEDGSVMEGPPSMAQPVYEVRVRDGRIEVRRPERVNLRRNPQGAESTGTEAG